MKIEKLTTLAKFDSEARIAEGIVYQPMTIDSQGDYATAATIEAAAHNFISKGLVKSIDIEHNGQPSGSTVVESRIAKSSDQDYPEGSWVMAVKCSEPVWSKVKTGDLKGFSLGGAAHRVKKSLNGQEANELVDLSISAVSLVRRGANQKEFSILKSEKEMSQEKLAQLIAKSINEAIAPFLDRPSLSAPVDVRKQAAEMDKIQIQKLSARREVLQRRLEAIWEGDQITNRVARQDELISEIEKCEDELNVLRGTNGDFPLNSVFELNGGTSQTLDSNFMSLDPLGVRQTDEMRKAESEIDLSAMGIMKI
jgi:hypothetical protein